MKLSKLNPRLLALGLSVIAETFLILFGFIFAGWQLQGPNPDAITGLLAYFCLLFHWFPGYLSQISAHYLPGSDSGMFVLFLVALLQWWLIFTVSIAVSRRFQKKR